MNGSQKVSGHRFGAKFTVFVGLALLVLTGVSTAAGQLSESAGISGSIRAFAEPSKKAVASPDPIVVDINQAGADELTKVPGIGKSTAQRIVEFRETHGRFERVDDLLKVKGIGERSLEKLRPFLKAGQKG